MLPKKELIIVFVRNPELGKVKTRLALAIGKKKALEIYKGLLKHTHNVLSNCNCDCAVFFSEQIDHNGLWKAKGFKKFIQKGDKLGEKMNNAFKKGFEIGYQKIIIIGSDLPDLNSDLIKNAFFKLTLNDYVIGPSEDGGYYLLGMKKLNSTLFKNKKWSANSVFNDTLKDIENSEIGMLPKLNDIDTFEDLKKSKLHKKLW